MSPTEKMTFIRRIEGSDLSISEPLAQCDVLRSTYDRRKRNLKTVGTKGLEDNRAHRARTWNRLLSHPLDRILEYATFYPELPCPDLRRLSSSPSDTIVYPNVGDIGKNERNSAILARLPWDSWI
jgi:hypothetical protein